VLTLGDVAPPSAGPGAIRIAVRAAGVSPGDAVIRSGAWRDRVPLTLPYVVGLDGAGVVDQVGSGVTGVRAGDEVFGYRLAGGTTAEYALLDGWAVKPPAMSWAAAGGAATGIETSVRALDTLGVGPGRTVLLDGAAGGVGAIATQIAVARGATVLGTASAANQDFLASLGAIPLLYGPGLPDRIPPGVRVDAAVDVAGHGGVAELVAITGGPASVITLIDGSAAALGVRLSRFDPAADVAGALTYGADLVARGRLEVFVAGTYPMVLGASAHARAEAGHARGKLIITVS
jgi:NADPH:quinone reductase-like Zn-dependent oxidoreductase